MKKYSNCIFQCKVVHEPTQLNSFSVLKDCYNSAWYLRRWKSKSVVAFEFYHSFLSAKFIFYDNRKWNISTKIKIIVKIKQNYFVLKEIKMNVPMQKRAYARDYNA